MSPWLSDLLLRTQTDERLVELAHLGNQRAFETIVERYRQPLQMYARRINPERADDLVQQTLLSALSALQAGTEVRHLRGWLYQILRHLAWGESASSPALVELEDAQLSTDSAQHIAEQRMLAQDTLAALAALPTRQQDALLHTAVHGHSRTEVADLMGLSEGAIRQLVHRARTTLRTAVTAITPLPVLRWLSSPKPSSALGMSETTLGAGAASGVGVGLKLTVGAIVASGVLAAGVIPVIPLHPHSGRARAGALPKIVAQDAAAAVGRAAGQPAGQRSGAPALLAARGGRSRGSTAPHRSSAMPQAGLAAGGQSVSGDAVGASGRGGQGTGGLDRHSGSGSSGPGSGNDGSRGSDGGKAPSGSGSGSGSGDGTSGGSDSHGGSGSGSGSGSGTSGGDGGGSSGSDGGSSGSGSSGSGGGDGGGSHTSGGGGSDGGGGSSSDGGGTSGSGSGTSSDGGGTSGGGGGSSSSGTSDGGGGSGGSTDGSGGLVLTGSGSGDGHGGSGDGLTGSDGSGGGG